LQRYGNLRVYRTVGLFTAAVLVLQSFKGFRAGRWPVALQ